MASEGPMSHFNSMFVLCRVTLVVVQERGRKLEAPRIYQ